MALPADRPCDPPVVPRHRGRITPMYLAHHFPEDYDRCVLVGRAHICRRCLVLYPVAIVVLVATYGWLPGNAVDAVAVVGLPLPGVVEFVLEHVGVLTYERRRQVAVTMLLGLGLGRGFVLYLQDHASRLFWGPVVLYTAVCVLAVIIRQRRAARTEA